MAGRRWLRLELLCAVRAPLLGGLRVTVVRGHGWASYAQGWDQREDQVSHAADDAELPECSN